MLLNLVTPVASPFGDPPVTGLNLIQVSLNPDALTAQAFLQQVGGNPGPGANRMVTVPITAGTTMTLLLAAIKAQVSSQFGVVFQ